MADPDTFENDAEIPNMCSICLRRSKHFYEMKPRGTTFLQEIFRNDQKRIFHVCTLCKLAIDFISQFERLCESSRMAGDSWKIIEARYDDYQEDPKIQSALGLIFQWVTRTLDENLKVNKEEEDEQEFETIAVISAVDNEQSIVEKEFDEELLPIVKTESLLEEYLIESDYEVEMDDREEEIVLEIKSTKKNPSPKKKEKNLAECFTCEVDDCQSKFLVQKSLSIHMSKVHGLSVAKKDKLPTTEVFACTEIDCKFIGNSKQKLNRHLQAVHDLILKKTFCCDVCGQVYPSKCRLQYHMNCHLNISPFKCDFAGCTRAFRNPTRLRNHKQEFHLQVIRMHCATCGKGFRTKASHDLHILGHAEPTIPCEVCGRLLTNRKTLRTHLMTHTGERRYKCTVEGCNKAFTKCSGLQVHTRSHTKEKPYVCAQCSVGFAYKVSMKKHMLKFHDIPWETSTHIKPEPKRIKVENATNSSVVIDNLVEMKSMS